MKKLKIFGLIVIIVFIALLLFSNCKKIKALENGFENFSMSISEQSQSYYGAVFIIDLSNNYNTGFTSSDFLVFESIQYYYLSITNTNTLNILSSYGTLEESYNLGSTRLLQFVITHDANSLYLIIYKLNYSLQYSPGLAPVVDGISRTMITRFNLGNNSYIYDQWQNHELDIYLERPGSQQNYIINYLVNCAYLDYSDSEAPQTINNWVDRQLGNYLTLSNLVQTSYDYGFGDGYNTGVSDGEDTGYSNGYDEGYEAGENAGYLAGYYDGERSLDAYDTGYDDGYLAGEQTQTAYQDGYRDGQSGETAISPVFRIISDVFGAIGAIMAVELVPHIPLGLFILVPLFFAALGLILWIWRRN